MKSLKKVIAAFRNGAVEEWLGRVLVLVVIIPVVINVGYRASAMPCSAIFIGKTAMWM